MSNLDLAQEAHSCSWVVLLGVHTTSERTSLKTGPEEWEERPEETGYNYGDGGGEEQPAGPSRRSSCHWPLKEGVRHCATEEVLCAWTAERSQRASEPTRQTWFSEHIVPVTSVHIGLFIVFLSLIEDKIKQNPCRGTLA